LSHCLKKNDELIHKDAEISRLRQEKRQLQANYDALASRRNEQNQVSLSPVNHEQLSQFERRIEELQDVVRGMSKEIAKEKKPKTLNKPSSKTELLISQLLHELRRHSSRQTLRSTSARFRSKKKRGTLKKSKSSQRVRSQGRAKINEVTAGRRKKTKRISQNNAIWIPTSHPC